MNEAMRDCQTGDFVKSADEVMWEDALREENRVLQKRSVVSLIKEKQLTRREECLV